MHPFMNAYFVDPLLNFELLQLGWATGGLLLWYMIQVADLDLTVDTQYYPDMDGPSAGFQLQGQFMAIGCFLVIMKSFKYMEMSAKLGMINRALARVTQT